jgi:glycosyltransferase involved in cell wall biosynthesis
MMSRDLGGIQQAYIDYSEALLMQNHEVINISSIKAKINNDLQPNHTLHNFGSWCFLSKIFLNILIRKYKPNVVICHGNRAINFVYRAAKKNGIKIVGISHNYSYKALEKCDLIIALTQDLKQHLIKQNIPEEQISLLPNMVRIEKEYVKPHYKPPIHVGSLGRFVQKKGFADLITSVKLIKQAGHNVKLIIGGDGVEKKNLENMVGKLNLKNHVQFLGWVDDKNKFFNQIDIFCLPSISEPFGIILLEAIIQSKPIVATNSGGPQEIIRDQQDGLIANINSPEDLAKCLIKLITDQEYAQNMSESAYYKVKKDYDIKSVSGQLSQILINLTK